MKMKKRRRRLESRIKAWNHLMTHNRSDAQVEQRKKAGGYKCPGSYNK